MPKETSKNERKISWRFLGGWGWMIYVVLAVFFLGWSVGRFAHSVHYHKTIIEQKVAAAQNTNVPAAPAETPPAGEGVKTPETAMPAEQTCATVEKLLLRQLGDTAFSEDPRDHFHRANVYSKVSLRGCPESSERFRRLALRELQIGFALGEDRMEEKTKAEVADTYNKLEMKADADKFFNKMKQLTDPTIDFIIQVQRIIEEPPQRQN
ncbi:MAG: hypothetical protein FWC61_02640 [Proteobacteria bacterium]|nr:hypothetical protein [Pseudomonadota bacterium]